MPDSPSDPSGGRPARPAIPPFRGPAGAPRPGAPARGPLTPRDGAAVPGAGPRPAVSPIVPRGPVGRPTPARPVVSPRVATPARAVTPASPVAPVRVPDVAPVAAQPPVQDAAFDLIETPPDAAAATSGLPMLDVTPTHDEPADAGVARASTGDDWLSAEGALRGEFGELVENIPTGRAPEAPVIPTPPAPWPAMGADTIEQPTRQAEEGTLEGLETSWLDETGLPTGAAAASMPEPASTESATDAGTDVGFGAWTPESSELAIPSEAADTPGVLEETAAGAEQWADAYGAEADAIHGTASAAELEGIDVSGLEVEHASAGDPFAGLELESAATADESRVSDWWAQENVGGIEPAAAPAAAADDSPVDEQAAYLASAWPEPAADPSTLPTPVVSMPAVVPPATGHVGDVASGLADQAAGFGWAEAMPTDAGDVDEPSTWDLGPAPEVPIGGVSGAQGATGSSLAAAEALERIAQQLREGTLRADGYSPALGEAAALSAVLAALLGIDARWDVQR